jgi:hypothetical protein
MSEKRFPQGESVIEEAARLFRQCRFSHLHGAYAEGQHVAVSIDPHWNEADETFAALISCLPFSSRRADWDQLPIQVLPAERSGVSALVRLDTRGQGLIPYLPPGEYHLTLRVRPMRGELVLARQLDRLAAAHGGGEEERRVWQGQREDGAVAWSIEETEEGDVQVAFETTTAQFAGHVILFHLLDPTSKQVQYSQRLTFMPTRTPGKWEAWCSIGSRTEFSGPHELLFEIVAPEEPQA